MNFLVPASRNGIPIKVASGVSPAYAKAPASVQQNRSITANHASIAQHLFGNRPSPSAVLPQNARTSFSNAPVSGVGPIRGIATLHPVTLGIKRGMPTGAPAPTGSQIKVNSKV